MDLFSGVGSFLAVARALSFGAAARELGVSTAAVSKAVSKLEGDLGVMLFTRTSRHVALTHEGELFLVRCQTAVDALRAGRDLLSRAGRVPSGTLKVSLSPILGRVVVPKLAELSARHPRLDFKLQITDRFVRLAEEDTDVVVRIGELEDSSLTARVLARPKWMTVASPSYLARHPPPKSVNDLERHNCLRFVTPRGTARDWTFLRRGEARAEKVATHGNLLIDDGQLLLEAAVAGQGIAQVFDFMVKAEVRAGRLVELLPELAADAPPIHALWLRRRAQAARIRVFIEQLGTAFSR